MVKNFLVLMDDQHSRSHLGCYGNDLVRTPNLDELAQRGTRFTKAYTNSPICVPARASLATGRYVHETACWDNAIAYDGSIRSWGHVLQESGVDVTSIGKLHYRFEHDPTGFDEQFIPMHLAGGLGDLMGSIRPDLPERTQSRKFAEKIGPGETEYTAYDRNISAKACDWLKHRAAHGEDRPFFLFISFIAPHFPLIVPQAHYDLYPHDLLPPIKQANPSLAEHPWWRAFNNCYTFDRYFRDDDHRRVAIASYYGLCTFVDELMGDVLQCLTDTGFSETTNIAFFSDHGENLGARGLWGKSVMYEESVGVPLILAGPDLPKGKVTETAVSLVDMFPTFLQAMDTDGTAAMTDRPGRSLFEIAAEGNDDARTVFSEYHGAAATSGAFMMRDGRYKYIHYVDYAPEFYDLESDPEEMANLAANPAFSETVKSFQYRLFDLVDPNAINAQALADQKALIERHGGVDKVLNRGGLSGTPVPGGPSTLVNVETG